MRRKAIISLIIIIMFLTVALRFLLWFPGRLQQFPVPPGAAMLVQREPGSNEESPKEVGKDLRILFAGDTSFGESYHGESFFDPRGYDYFLEKLAPLLNQSDLVIANLETPLTDLTESPLLEKKRYLHWGDMHKTSTTLVNHNIRSVSLANNHMLDYGVEGLLQTLQTLRKNNIEWFGAGLNASQASIPLRRQFMLDGHPFHLVVASGFEYRRRYNWVFRFYAKRNSGGINRWKRKDAAEQIRKLRQADRSAFIVASPHWGQNYCFKTEDQTKLAHTLIEAGSDLVIGHGAHVLQEIEYYRDRWIIYSLGNFVFNSPGRYQSMLVDPFSLAAGLDVINSGGYLALTLRLYPIFSDNLITDYQPRLVTQEELAKVKSVLLQHSPDPVHLQKELNIGIDGIGLFLILDVANLPRAK